MLKTERTEREARDRRRKEEFEVVRKEMGRLVKSTATLELAYEVKEDPEQVGIQ